ncbi:TauD/TfdA family dioxygenase [Streptomyces graminilatus]|uniref:TauD/TfdA family dioxygenase n=1 Tax=Streptomyces graminilatus TaxID=1464070 RepID=UPI0006E274D4|nr:TauD/TfdA family dioxygenase [Streptomyces graminilatus]
MECLTGASPRDRSRILREELDRQPGCVVVEGVPVDGNEALLSLAKSLGSVTARGTTIPGHPLEDGRVYRVEPVNAGQGVRDEDDLLIFSTTGQVFEGHTDGYHNVEPPAYVLLLCVRPDHGLFGRTSVIDAAEALPRLDPRTAALLYDEDYPCAFGRTSILSGPRARPRVRFNFKEIQRFHAAGHVVDDAHLRAARALHELVSGPALAWRHLLQAGECLVIDNSRALHARESLSPQSTRLLKRVWVDPVDMEGSST